MAAVSKRGRGRKALKALSQNEVNVSAGKIAASPLPPSAEAVKEIRTGLSLLLAPNDAKRGRSKPRAPGVADESFANELEELQGRLERLRLEKETAEELLKQKDEMLKEKEEEIENRGKEQQRLRNELKKLQKVKEFKPTMSLPLVKSLREEQGKKEKKNKNKNKDCPEKKKPCPAYVLWLKDQWSEVKKENPDADFKEISNSLGAKWKTLSTEEKKPYEEKYQQEKEAYLQIVGLEKRENEAMKLLEEEHMQKTAMELLEQYLKFKQEAEKEAKKKKKEKDPLKPKQPMSAFFLFSKERRPTLLQESKNVTEIAKVLGEEWKNMTEEKRAPYEEIARNKKEEYDRQMEIYKQKQLEEAAALEKGEEEQKKVLKQEALQLLKKKEKTENIIKKTKETRQKKKKQKAGQNSDPKKPRKPASSFILFSKETRKQLQQERPGINNSTLNALISVKWKEISEGEKQVWNSKAAEGMAAYKREMEEYNKSIAMVNNSNNPTQEE